MKGAGRATIFLFSFSSFFLLLSFLPAVTGLVNLFVLMPYAESQEARAHKSVPRTLADQYVWCWLVKTTPPPSLPFSSRPVRRKMGRQAHGNVSTSSCDEPGVITHVPAPPSQFYQYVLMRNKVEKISSWVPISERPGSFLVLRFNHTSSDFSAWVRICLWNKPV